MSYKVQNFSNAKSEELQKDIKQWIEGMSSINIETINVWFDPVCNVHLATIVYECYLHQ